MSYAAAAEDRLGTKPPTVSISIGLSNVARDVRRTPVFSLAAGAIFSKSCNAHKAGLDTVMPAATLDGRAGDVSVSVLKDHLGGIQTPPQLATAKIELDALRS